MRLEALRSPSEPDYLVAVYREMEVSALGSEGQPPVPLPRPVRVWAEYDLIRSIARTAEGALRQALGFLEIRCA